MNRNPGCLQCGWYVKYDEYSIFEKYSNFGLYAYACINPKLIGIIYDSEKGYQLNIKSCHHKKFNKEGQCSEFCKALSNGYMIDNIKKSIELVDKGLIELSSEEEEE